MAIEAIRNKKAKLVLYASDASANTKKKVVDKANFYGVEAIEVEDSQTLSDSVGKSGRMVIAILSDGFAKKMKEKLGEGEKYGKNE